VSTLFGRVARAEDRGARLEARLGHPHRHHLLIRHLSYTEANQPVITDHLIDPMPIITNVPPRSEGRVIGNSAQAIVVNATDFEAKVSRSLPYSLFIRDDGVRAQAYMYPSVDSQGRILYKPGTMDLVSGTEATILFVSDSDCCDWVITLRKMKDRT